MEARALKTWLWPFDREGAVEFLAGRDCPADPQAPPRAREPPDPARVWFFPPAMPAVPRLAMRLFRSSKLLEESGALAGGWVVKAISFNEKSCTRGGMFHDETCNLDAARTMSNTKALFILFIVRPVFFSEKERACYCRLTQFGFLFDSPAPLATKLLASEVRQVKAEWAKSGFKIHVRRVGALIGKEFVPASKAA